MGKIGIKYCGPVYDGSGYAQFARNFIVGLSRQEAVDLTVQAVSFERARPNLGAVQEIIKGLDNKSVDYKIKIINVIPDMLPMHAEAEKTNLCFTMFETTRIPGKWVECLNQYAQGCLVPCTWNKEVFENSGVKVPIYVAPPGIETSGYTQSEETGIMDIGNLPPDCVAFYSIFQWTERKNPVGLLHAYLSAFDNVEDVCLILKTYGSDTSPAQQQRVKGMILAVKQQLRMKNPPKILFLGGLLSNEQIAAIHKRGDCFVLPHRAEGFGMPHLEAMARGKPVISTGFSGNMDFMNKDNSYLLDYQMTVVANMPWIPYYEADMEWAEPNISQLKGFMKQVYEDVKLARDNKYTITRALASRGQKEVLEKFNLDIAAERLVKICKEISRE